jgi:hypothetical protein
MKIFEPNFKDFKFKNDKYRSERGGQTAMIEIDCVCSQPIMIYQKDGYKKQHLYRTYLNRIFYPENLEILQRSVNAEKDLPELICPSCGIKIGTPMKHDEGRLAFGLIMGTFIRKRLPKQNRFEK